MLPAFDEDCCPLGDLHAEVAARFRWGDQTAAMPPSRALLKPPTGMRFTLPSAVRPA
jgi:hypothetical protein